MVRAQARLLLTPAGFLLALVFFAFPFAAVSCEDQELGSVNLTYTGVGLATGADPRVEIDDRSGSLDETASQPSPPAAGVEVLAGGTAVLILAGLGTSLIRPVRVRRLAAGGVAAVAGLLLMITELVALDNLDAGVRRLAEVEATAADLDVVHTRVGFWLSLAALVVVAVLNIAVAVRAWVRQ